MSKRKQHHPEFKAKVALEALKGEEPAILINFDSIQVSYPPKIGH